LEVVHDKPCLPVAVHQIRTQIWCMDTSIHVFARGQDWLRGSHFGLRLSVINCATEEVRFALEVVHDKPCLPVAVHQIRMQIRCMDTSIHVFARGQDWLRGTLWLAAVGDKLRY